MQKKKWGIVEGKGKAVETHTFGNFPYYNYDPSDFILCRKHPEWFSVGVCAYCLRERLSELVSSDCGHQLLSSRSSSSASSYLYSFPAEMGSTVGRISFLVEKERKLEKSEDQFILLKSSSTSGGYSGVKRSRVWKILKFFKKKRGQGCGIGDKLVENYMGFSRSRSLCSFRPEKESQDFSFSSAKTSDFSRGNLVIDPGRPSGFSEAEGRKAHKKSAFPLKESDFRGMDESGFIDLKLDGGGLINDAGRKKKEEKAKLVWRWIFSHHPDRIIASKKDEHHVVRASC